MLDNASETTRSDKKTKESEFFVMWRRKKKRGAAALQLDENPLLVMLRSEAT